MTVRRALTTLKGQGLISCVQGRGSFVRSPDLSKSTFRLASHRENGWTVPQKFGCFLSP